MTLRSTAPWLLALSLPACYESNVPIADRAASLDARLVGQWRCVAPQADDTVVFSIKQGSGADLDVEMIEAGKPPDRYRAQPAKLDGMPLANVQEIGEDGKPGKWVLARYTLHRPNLLEMEIAQEKAFEGAPAGTSPREVARKHLKAGDLFEPFCACVRMRP